MGRQETVKCGHTKTERLRLQSYHELGENVKKKERKAERQKHRNTLTFSNLGLFKGYYAFLKRLARDKHSSLPHHSISDED